MYSVQTVGWMNMPLGTEVGFGPHHIVLDEDPLTDGKWHISPHFSVHVSCGQTAGWIKMLLGTEVGLGPGDSVLDGEPSCNPLKVGTAPTFRPMSLVAKRLDGSECHLAWR